MKLDNSFTSRSSLFSLIFVLIAVNLIVFIPTIILHPSFLTDDYLIFAKIKQNISTPISTNPSEEFFLFLRPVVYFSFWLDYNIWHTYAIGMKITTLLLHLFYVVIFLLTIINIRNFLKKQVPNYCLLLLAIAFSFYPDHLISIEWIANRTELLSSMFYAVAVLSVFKYLTTYDEKKYLLYVYFISFLFSILSKQQGIHLPFLILFLLIVFKNRFLPDRYRNILTFSIIGTIFSIVISFLNYKLFPDYIINFSQFITKKPFSFIGIIIYLFNPNIGSYLYSFFIVNKSLALVLLCFLILFLFYFIRIRKILINATKLLILILLTAIIFYPRVFAVGGNRLNSIQVLWFYLIISIVLMFRFNKTNVFLVIFLIGLNLTSLIINYKNDLNLLKLKKSEIKNLVIQENKYQKELYVLTCPDITLLSYELYYFKYNNFGKYDLNYSPIQYRSLISCLNGLKTKKIKCILSNKHIFISIILKNIFLIINTKDLNEPKSKLIIEELINSDEKRDSTYKLIEVKFLNDFLINHKIIYFSGIKWEFLN